jgi:hypothetical protein
MWKLDGRPLHGGMETIHQVTRKYAICDVSIGKNGKKPWDQRKGYKNGMQMSFSLSDQWYKKKFSELFLLEQKPVLFIFSSAAPQRTAYREVPFQMAALLRIGSPL